MKRVASGLFPVQRPTDDVGSTREDELEDALQLRDDVLAIVGHDITNALQAIRLASGVLKRQTKGTAAAVNVDTIMRVTDRLARLTGDLTDLALLEGGRLSLLTAPFDPGEVVESAAVELLPGAAEKSIHLRIRRPSTTVFGRGDRSRILQVLLNLGGNAIKFSPPGAVVELGAEIDARSFRFFVADDGPGIPASLRDRVWRAGVRAPSVAGGGVGLGLAIARAVVDLMRGQLAVEGAEPHGARFVFEIPRFATIG